MTPDPRSAPASDTSPRLPLGSLIALGTAGFVTIMTEALPAGVLPAMSGDLGVDESAAGQTVTVYAIGSALAAVPLTAATAGWSRKRVLLLAIAGFAVANTITAVSSSYAVTLTARLLGGAVAGLLWALMAGYARRLVPAEQRGRATAIAMAGTPVALSIGVPCATVLSDVVGWRGTFGIMTALSLTVFAWTLLAVPDVPRAAARHRPTTGRVLRIPGIAPVLAVTVSFVLAHNVLYTYIAPYLGDIALGHRVDAVLLTFGIASVLGILVTGALIDRHLRALAIAGSAAFTVAALILGLGSGVPALAYVGAAVWGLGFGGGATVLQTASAEAAGTAGDIAQSLVVTCWNVGIAAGAVAGGAILASTGAGSLPWWTACFVAIALAISLAARRTGFPGPRARSARREAASDPATS